MILDASTCARILAVPTGIISNPPAPQLPGIAEEQLECGRFARSTFETGTAPAQDVGTDLGAVISNYAYAAAAGCNGTFWFGHAMRAAPTVTTYGPSAATANWTTTSGSTAATASVTEAAEDSVSVLASTNTVLGFNYAIHLLCTCEL